MSEGSVVSAVSFSLEPGAVVDGKWRIVQPIAAGNMGRVFRAVDLTLQRAVALKVVSVDSDEHRARMEREAKLLAKLDHPHIVPVYAFGQIGPVTFLVMKQIEGRTLRDLVGDVRPSTAELLSILRQVASGLDHVHDKGLIHRDVKPANIVIGFDLRATLVDFGISRELAGASAKDITQEGKVLGTLPFASPEVLSDPALVDHRSDVYALAVTAYRVLFSTVPFEGDTDFAQLRAKLAGRFRPPSALGFEARLDSVFAKAFSPTPESRQNRCSELIEDIARALDEQTTVLDGLIEPVVEPVAKRSARPTVALIGASLVLAGGLLVLATGLLTEHRQQDAGSAEPAVEMALPIAPAIPVLIEPMPSVVPTSGTEEVPPPVADVAKEKPIRKAVKPILKDQKVRLVVTVKGESSWGQVLVDGKETKQAPCLIVLAPGRHSLVMQHPGFRPQRRDLVIGLTPNADPIEFRFD